MKLPKELTTVTAFSKAFALVLFIILPFYGFYLGTLYQQTLDGTKQLESMANQKILIPAQEKQTTTPSSVYPPKPSITISAKQESNGKKCAQYTSSGISTTVCATCGNGVCEAYETCTPSYTNKMAATSDCGPLYCSQDCK